MPRSGVSRRRLLASLGAAPVASMLPSARAATSSESCVHTTADAALRTEPLALLILKLRLAGPADAAIGSAIIEGGEVTGGILRGTVLPGSFEWSRDEVRGVTHLTARYGLQSQDGSRYEIRDRASVSCAQAPAWAQPITTATELESLAGADDAAARGLLIGRLDASAIGDGTLHLGIHRIV